MITRIQIDNFKSIKGLDVRLGLLNYVVGPNASGKSNLAEALDFVSHAVREDLAYAVAEKGGFFNICHRRLRRARGAITFHVEGAFERPEVQCNFDLFFQIRTKTEEIRSDFFVASERFTIEFRRKEHPNELFLKMEFKREDKAYHFDIFIPNTPTEDTPRFLKNVIRRTESLKGFFPDAVEPLPQQLLISGFLKEYFPLNLVVRELQGLRVFQLNPRLARQPAAPSIHGDLGRRGENLASALDRLRSDDPKSFVQLRNWLRDVVPTFANLLTDYTETRQLGLFFEEEGFSSKWFAEDVSDGTIMSVALFFTLLDKRHKNIVIEEPETSLHPWILRKFLERCREQSRRCQIIITTHSPLAIATARPDELFLIERTDGVTNLRKATDVESDLNKIIKPAILDLGQYWLSGGLGAVPTLPEVKQDELFGNG